MSLGERAADPYGKHEESMEDLDVGRILRKKVVPTIRVRGDPIGSEYKPEN